MKRMHVGLSVTDLEASIRFYSSMFGTEPHTRKDDYAKWMLDDPSLNFSISTRSDDSNGRTHFGIQVDSEAELDEASARLNSAGAEVVEQRGVTCCYHDSDKSWVKDPDGYWWETFYTKGANVVYGTNTISTLEPGAAAENTDKQRVCCTPN